jgi:hypothetical protein
MLVLLLTQHAWQATPANMLVSLSARTRGCPFCAGKRVSERRARGSQSTRWNR